MSRQYPMAEYRHRALREALEEIVSSLSIEQRNEMLRLSRYTDAYRVRTNLGRHFPLPREEFEQALNDVQEGLGTRLIRLKRNEAAGSWIRIYRLLQRIVRERKDQTEYLQGLWKEAAEDDHVPGGSAALTGGAPRTRGRPNTRSRGKPSAEAKAITSGRKLDHLRRRRPAASTSAPSLPIIAPSPPVFDGLPDLIDLPDLPDSPPNSPLVPPPSPTPDPDEGYSVMKRGWNRFVKANLRKMKDPLRGTVPEDELHREAMKRVGEAWRALPMSERLDYGATEAPKQAKRAQTGVAPKINPYTGDDGTRADLRQYRRRRKKAEKKDRDLIYKKLRDFNKTTVRRSVGRLKKMFRGPPGHWKSKFPLKNLASTFNKVNRACDALAANQNPKFLLPPNVQHQYVTGDPDYDEDEEITFPN